jgi:hypothetical protein
MSELLLCLLMLAFVVVALRVNRNRQTRRQNEQRMNRAIRDWRSSFKEESK